MPRCGRPRSSLEGLPCGQIAHWSVDGQDGQPIGYFCDECRPAGANAIGNRRADERVRLSCTVELGAVSALEPLARAEAVGYLERVLEAAGGSLTVGQVWSHAGLRRAQSAPGGGNGWKGVP